MAKKEESNLGLTVKKEDDMIEWYSQVVQKAELADASTVQGFMVIRPNAYAVWEQIQQYFNARMQKLGVRNAYFPLLIPENFFKKEAEHAEGFNPELAWINRKEGGERLAIRPTSETIIYDSYSKWIRSYRDLPMRINQWCNVLRWEVSQTKLFLRTREFLWQEGHCAYETEEECNKEVMRMLDEYETLCKDVLAIPVLKGIKTENEKFAGAVYTSTIEALMPDGKALQMGTSHNLGQGFAKGFNITFLGKDEKQHHPWQSSWGFSTRLLGAIIMVHGDNKGLVIPPRVAAHKMVIIPIFFDKDKAAVLDKARSIAEELESYNPVLDDRENYTPGWKYNEHELKGTPLRIEIGPKDLEKKQVVLVRRDTGEKRFVPFADVKSAVDKALEAMHAGLYASAEKRLKESILPAKDTDELCQIIDAKKMALVSYCGSVECADWIKAKTQGATARCIKEKKKGTCIHCQKESSLKVYFARNY